MTTWKKILLTLACAALPLAGLAQAYPSKPVKLLVTIGPGSSADILARMLYGGRISLAVGMSAMLMAITVGVIIGAIAGISRGWVDAVLMWVTDLFLSLPQLPLLLLLIRLPLVRTMLVLLPLLLSLQDMLMSFC